MSNVFFSLFFQIAEKYAHDYDDGEICADIGMCIADSIGVTPQAKGSKGLGGGVGGMASSAMSMMGGM